MVTDGDLGRPPLQASHVVAEQARQPVRQQDFFGTNRLGAGAGDQVAGYEHLVSPVAVEVEPGPDEPERTVARPGIAERHRRARRDVLGPQLESGPGEPGEVGLILRFGGGGFPDRGQVGQHVAHSGGPHSQGGRQYHELIAVTAQAGKRGSYVDICRQ